MLASCVDRGAGGGSGSVELHVGRAVNLHVAAGAPPGGDGSGASPFGSIQEAVDAAEALGGGTIHVRPGTYRLVAPIEIMSSFIRLKGQGEALCAPDLDHPTIGQVLCDDDDASAGDGALHPIGRMVVGTETRIEPVSGVWDSDFVPSSNWQPLIKVGCGQTGRWEDTCPDGVLRGIEISGLTLDARGPEPRAAVAVRRAVGFQVRGVVIEGGNFGVFTSGSSGRVERSHVSGVSAACALCINAPLGGDAGGEPDAGVDLAGNTLEGNFLGIFLIGSSTGLRQLGDHLDVDVRGNVIRNNSLGVRIAPQLRPYGWPGFSQVTGNVTARLTGNELEGNADHAYLFDNGFGYREDVTGPDIFDFDYQGTPSPCAPRWFTGTLHIRLSGEVVGPRNGPAEINFTRPLGSGFEHWQYLHHAKYTIVDPGNALHAFDGPDSALRAGIDHPQYDPYQDLFPTQDPRIDECKSQRLYDQVGGPRLHPGTPLVDSPTALDQALGNTLTINGVVMPHSRLSEGGVDCSGPLLQDCFSACDDLADNDADGTVDADDPDCADTCHDQADNDDDSAIDGNDDSCHATCSAALDCAGACVFLGGVIPGFDVLGCSLERCPLGHDPRGFELGPLCDLRTDLPKASEWFPLPPTYQGGPVTDAYHAAIRCAALSGCGGNLPCLLAACGPAFTACQQTPCQE